MDLERVWKHFGKNTEAGKLLYQIYGVNYKPEDHINYPKLKINKNKQNINLSQNNNKSKRSVTVGKVLNKISYPSINKTNVLKPVPKIDLIAKRKSKNKIQKDVAAIKEEAKKHPILNPLERNRKEIIEKLQYNFQYQEKTYLPKNARPPKIDFNDISTNIESNIEILNSKNFNKLNKSKACNQKECEYDKLSKAIFNEIEERYNYIKEIKEIGGDINQETKILNEIKDRLQELKTIQKLKEN